MPLDRLDRQARLADRRAEERERLAWRRDQGQRDEPPAPEILNLAASGHHATVLAPVYLCIPPGFQFRFAIVGQSYIEAFDSLAPDAPHYFYRREEIHL